MTQKGQGRDPNIVLSRTSKGPWGGADLRLLSPQPDTSRSCKTTDTGPVHRVVCRFTSQLSLVLINRPRRDSTLSWRWYTVAVGGIRTTTSRSQVRHRTTRPPRTFDYLILVVKVVGELQRKRTLAASRGFVAAARLSCYSRSWTALLASCSISLRTCFSR